MIERDEVLRRELYEVWERGVVPAWTWRDVQDWTVVGVGVGFVVAGVWWATRRWRRECVNRSGT